MKGHEHGWCMKHLSCLETMRYLGLFSWENRKHIRDFINTFKYVKEGREAEGAKLFLAASSERTRYNVYKLKHWKLPLYVWENFPAARVTEHHRRLLRVVLNSLCLGGAEMTPGSQSPSWATGCRWQLPERSSTRWNPEGPSNLNHSFI